MKRELFALIGCVGLLGGAFGAIQVVDGVEWRYTENSSGFVTIQRGVRRSAIPPRTAGVVKIPETLGTNGYPVTTIGTWAFYDCTNLTGVVWPKRLEKISTSAFAGCTSLSSLTFPTSIVSVASGAFSNCTSLASVTVKGPETRLGSKAFSGCPNIRSLVVPGTQQVKTIFPDISAPLKSARVTDGVETIAASAFRGCAYLKELTVPASITRIESSAFSYCSNLTSVVFLGNAPDVGFRRIYANCPESLTTYVYWKSTGWLAEGTRGLPLEGWPAKEPRSIAYVDMPPPQGMTLQNAAAFTGYLTNEKDELVGLLSAKVARPSRRAEVCRMTATVKGLDGHNEPIYSGEFNPAMGSAALSNRKGEILYLMFNGDEFWGWNGRRTITGARNIFRGKEPGDEARAAAVLGKFQGSYAMLWDGGFATINVQSRGKTRIAITTTSGRKATVTSQLQISGTGCRVPVFATRLDLAFNVVFDKTFKVEGLQDAYFGRVGTALGKTVDVGVLPSGYYRYDHPLDEAFKFRFQARTGQVKGSFKVYALEGGRERKVVVSATGALIGDTAYCIATIRKAGSWLIKITP